MITKSCAIFAGSRLEKRPPSGDLGFLRALTDFVIASQSRKPRRLDGVFSCALRLRFFPRRRWNMTGLARPIARALAAAGDAVSRRRSRREVAAAADAALLRAGHRRLHPGGDLRRRHDAARGRARTPRRHRARRDGGRPPHVPIGLGLSGADTSRMKDALDETADWPIDCYLIASPYYVRPSQRGLLPHFEALADHAAWPIALYNIPYRTARRHHQPDAAAACRASQHHRAEGLRREPRAIDRAAARPAEGLSRADRRGRATISRRSATAPTAASCCQPISRPRRSPPCMPS